MFSNPVPPLNLSAGRSSSRATIVFYVRDSGPNFCNSVIKGHISHVADTITISLPVRSVITHVKPPSERVEELEGCPGQMGSVFTSKLPVKAGAYTVVVVAPEYKAVYTMSVPGVSEKPILLRRKS